MKFMRFKTKKNVIFPDFQLAESTRPGKVVLKVKDLAELTAFYRDIIGLTVFEAATDHSILGAGDKILLVLQQISDPLPLSRKTGLYHVAFLLPTRKDLGNALFHYLKTDAIDGAADHGYSEALYLTDPEGNGIEVYHDKPMSEWDMRKDGEIVGVTEELDAQSVFDAGDRDWRGFPAGTQIGHVHLKVADLQKTETFYTDLLGESLKNNFGDQAKFFATGKYHHHIGTNTWLSKGVTPMTDKDPGLAYFSFYVADLAELERIQKHWQEKQAAYQKEPDGSLWITDPNGIRIKFEKTNQLS